MDKLWAYFDGVTGGDPRRCGAGGILFSLGITTFGSKLDWVHDRITILNLVHYDYYFG